MRIAGKPPHRRGIFIGGIHGNRMDPPACNISPAGKKRRKIIGQILVVLAGAASGYLIAAHAPWSTRLAVFPLFFAGFFSLLESERNVCVMNAVRKKADPQ